MPDGAPYSAKTPVKAHLHTEPMSVWQVFKASRRNILEIIPDVITKQPILSGHTGVRWHMVAEPAALRRILRDNLENYPKSTVTKAMLRPAIGDSIFIAEGAEWRWQRQAAAPVFKLRNITALGPIMTRAAEATAERLSRGGTINVMDEMVRTTFDVIIDVTFRTDQGFEASAVHKAVSDYIDNSAKLSLLDLFGVPDWMPRPSRMLSRASMREMRRIADESIANRRAHPTGETDDLLDLLMQGSDPETGRQMNTTELRDNILTFIVAGHETTSLALTWSLYLLAFDRDAQARLREEAAAINGPIGAEHLPDLPYTRAVIDEAMRLYPPAAFLSRTAQAPDTLCGREIRAGDTVALPIYALHRHHDYWEALDAFRPERFLDKKPERYTYLPFGDGPRICIGASFALQEAVIILATLVRQFDFARIPGKDPVPNMILTLRPEHGVELNVHPITASTQTRRSIAPE